VPFEGLGLSKAQLAKIVRRLVKISALCNALILLNKGLEF